MGCLDCPLCLTPTFESLSNLQGSLLSVITRHLTCPLCQEVLCGLDKFTLHVLSHSLTESSDVPASATSVPMLEAQELRASPENVPSNPREEEKGLVKCRLCGLEQESVEGLRNHHAIHHPEKPCLCSLCFKSFKVPASLAVHKRLAHNVGTSFPCSVCGRKFATKYRRDQHEKRHIGLKEFLCNICGTAFYERFELTNHLERHAGDKPHLCATCGKGFVTKSELKSHESVHSDDRTCVCSTCGKGFKKEQHLIQHARTHEAKQWECEECHKFFTSKYFLKKHMRLHTGEMPYKCEQCNKTFTFQQSYHKHLQYHKDDRPHVCATCGKSFKELSTLYNHERIHTGEKPYVCETCGKAFRQRVSYLVHKRIHTGILPYTCTACGKSFRYKVSQKSHKCEADSPGVIVRRCGDFLQKLKDKAQQQQQNAQKGDLSFTLSAPLPPPPVENELNTFANNILAEAFDLSGINFTQFQETTTTPSPRASNFSNDNSQTGTTTQTMEPNEPDPSKSHEFIFTAIDFSQLSLEREDFTFNPLA